MSMKPARVPMTLFAMVASIEIARRQKRGPTIPSDLEESYLAALQQIPMLVGCAGPATWDHWYCEAVLAAVAASKGFYQMAEAVLELDPDTIKEVLRQKYGEA
jgi:hypothetical protein